MPWSVRENDDRCPASKPWSVVNDKTGDLRGCHPDKASARQQQKALYANVPDAERGSMGERYDQVKAELDLRITRRSEGIYNGRPLQQRQNEDEIRALSAQLEILAQAEDEQLDEEISPR
jgi:hypothetical protein